MRSRRHSKNWIPSRNSKQRRSWANFRKPGRRVRHIPRPTLLIATGLILGGSLERNSDMFVELRLVFRFWVAPMVHP